jgi:hypothetical protein
MRAPNPTKLKLNLAWNLRALSLFARRSHDNSSEVAVKIRNKIAGVAVAVIAGVGLFPVAAQAATGRRLYVPLTLNGSTKFAWNNSTFTAGDCTQWGRDYPNFHNPSYYELTLLDAAGDVQVHWHGVTRTDASWTADVWHQWFIFHDAANNVYLSTESRKLDSPPMDPTYAGDTEFDRYQTFTINPNVFSSITYVDVWGDC